MANEKKAKESEGKASNEKKAEEVIDNICAKKEESYDQFMKLFTMLKKEDVIQQLMKDVGDEMMSGPIKMQNEGDEMMSEPIKMEDEVTAKTILTFKNKNPMEVDDDDVETEILVEGTSVGSMSTNVIPTGKKAVQFDNFVDEVESDQEEDDETDGLEGGKYVASFSHQINDVEDVNLTNVEECEDSDTPLNCSDVRPIPGEADDENDNAASLQPVINTTQLDLSSRLQPSLDQIISKPIEMESDDVVPFSLDEEFDYDNVILTPKWSVSDRPPGFANGT